MIRATAILKSHTGPVIDEVTLDYEDRHRRRMTLTGVNGTAVLLDLPEVPDLRDGDALSLVTGDAIRVRSAPEDLMEIHARDAIHLTRIAWHIGNRHLAAMITADSLIIRADHVIAQMVEGLGGHVHAISAPFDPERGAYAGAAATHGHSHAESHAHAHAHSHHHD
jgi:urease accessory protein